MKRLSPWLLGLGLVGAACSPKFNVQPGAPVLKSIMVVESAGPTVITGSEKSCLSDAIDTAACDPPPLPPPTMFPVTDPTLCRTDESWCRCQPTDPADPSMGGHWNCLFEPTSMVVATFDRLLDIEPQDYDMAMGMPMGRTDVASFMSTPGTAPQALVAYASSGSKDSLIFNLLGSFISGPRLFISGSPGLPSGSTLTLSLDRTKVRAKDHVSFFVGEGSLKDGVFRFTTAAFSVGIEVPTAPPPDAGNEPTDAGEEAGVDASVDAAAEAGSDGGVADDAGVDAVVADTGADAPAEVAPEPPPLPVPALMQPVTITFNNLTDPAAIPAQITVMAGTTAITNVDIVATDDGGTRVYTVTPKSMMTWPKGQTITVTVSANAADVQGVKLGLPSSATFVTEP
jgi:hypothetical protein